MWNKFVKNELKDEPWLFPLPSGFEFDLSPGKRRGSFFGSRQGQPMPGKRVQLDDETWASLDLLAKDRMMTFQELADEAFRDLLKKHGRPASLKEALRKSAGVSAEVVPLKRRKPTRKRTRS